MNKVDNTYKQVVKEVLQKGEYKKNRTGVDTISKFGVSYSIDNSEGFPLLTTKKMDGARWNSLLHELLWYLSGEEHIRNLQEETGIWDAWADDDGNLDTAYGRFWRNYPVPGSSNRKEGEEWIDLTESKGEGFEQGFDQIQHVVDNLRENPNSRRHVVSAWHPANAAASDLPPCHYTFVFNVQGGDTLNLHLTQRSGDIALGVPFNIASYALLQKIIAQEVGMEVGEFHHTIVDAHIYCGKGERGKWWRDNKGILQEHVLTPDVEEIEKEAPDDPDGFDHIPGLLNQLQNNSHDRASVEIADKPMDELEFEDFTLKNYNSAESIQFGVAE